MGLLSSLSYITRGGRERVTDLLRRRDGFDRRTGLLWAELREMIGTYILGFASGLAHAVRERSKKQNRTGKVPRALAIVKDAICKEQLTLVFREMGWVLSVADTTANALEGTNDRPFGVILYDVTETWRTDLSRLSSLEPRPWIVAVSGDTNGNFCDELERHGICDVLRLPLDRNSVVSTVEWGWRLWLTQQMLRQTATAEPPGGIPHRR
jgi:hypothetical protein